MAKPILSALIVAPLIVASPSFPQEHRPTLAEKLKARAATLSALKDMDPRRLGTAQMRRIAHALLLGVEYGQQARVDEEAGYDLAHQKAAYDWGYHVGDPQTVRLARLYWEGVQLGVFGIGDLQQNFGEKSKEWAAIESAVGGNGKEYDVNRGYIDDIFNDVQIAVDGAERAADDGSNNFNEYSKILTSPPDTQLPQ